MTLALVEVVRNINIVMVKVLKKNIRQLVLFSIVLIMGFSVQADTGGEIGRSVMMFKDPRIDYMQQVYSAKNKIEVKVKALYRVQVIASKSRSEVNDAKAYFSSKYPEMPVFISFSPPTFKMRAGNFVSRDDAQRFLKEIRKNYPASFVVAN